MSPVVLPVLEDATIEELDALDGVLDADARSARRLELARREEDDARVKDEARAAALEQYTEIKEAYLQARARVLSSTEAFIAARETANELRAAYDAAWRAVADAGAVREVGVRIEPGFYSRDLNDRFLTAVNGRGSRW